jgi:uncharacterized protein
MLDSILLQIAKSSILNEFDSYDKSNLSTLSNTYPYLKNDGASFVTLHYNENLRGCIGSLVAHRPLLDDIIQNAKSAAFNDPRFEPLIVSEFPNLNLEVSVLSQAEILEYSDYDDLLAKVQPKVDGLILKYGAYQGTFLPQVWAQLPSANEFLEHLSMKAGLHPSIYTMHPTIYRYRVDSLENSFNEILPIS